MTLNRLFEGAEQPTIPGKIRRGLRVEIAGGLKVFFVVALCCCGSGAGAAISTITETMSLAPELADYSSAPVSFQKFDASLGRLSSVEIILQGTGEMTQRYENTTKHAVSTQFNQGLELLLTLPNGRPLLDACQMENHVYQAGPFDGVVDFGGTSGGTGIYDVTAEEQRTLRSGKGLALFTGSGLADLFLSTGTSFNGTHFDGRTLQEAQALVGADITVIYNYIAVPEPDAYGIGAGVFGLAAAGGMALRARKFFWRFGQ